MSSASWVVCSADLVATAAVLNCWLGNPIPAEAGTVDVTAPSPHSYGDSSVRQLKTWESCGRYITFIGRSTNSWQGTNGYYNPGTQVLQSAIPMATQPPATELDT